jgi:Tol biopolymer transport system component
MEWYDYPAISPDGQRLVLPGVAADGVRHLWVRSLDSLTEQTLVGTEGAYLPSWSADSHSIGFTDGHKFKRIDAAGGPAVTLCNAEIGYGAWNRDGVILFDSRSGLRRVSAAGGEPAPVLELDKSRQETEQRAPQFLPDGRHFLYLSRSPAAGRGGIFLGSMDSKETRMLLPIESNASYVAPGFLIYGRQTTLLAQPFDAGKLRLSGEAVPIAEQVGRMEYAPILQFSASQNGVLVYSSTSVNSRVRLAWYNREGVRQRSIGDPGLYSEPRLSPDEKRLAVTIVDSAAGKRDIWVLELSTGILSRVTSHSCQGQQWSPDSRELVFGSDQKGHLDLYRKAVGGGGEELVLESDEDKWAAQWLKDNSLLVVNASGQIFYRLPLSGVRKPENLFQTEFESNAPIVSPDGHWVAFQSVESGRWEIYVAAFPSFKEKRQVSNAGGGEPHWRKDGKELFYLSLDGKIMSIDVKAGASLETGAPRVLFQSPLLVQPYDNVWDVTGDGKRFLLGEPVDEGRKSITVVLNWTAGLKH